MKKRTPALVVVGALTIGLLSATPAHAAVRATQIRFPNGAAIFYGPFDGPADITFEFNDSGPPSGVDSQATFQLRLRFKDGATIHTQNNVIINPSSDESPKVVPFQWPTLRVNVSTQYEVAVYQGGVQRLERTFTLKPYLAKITSISPDPFFPTITDGFKDTTRISYHLAANVTNVQIVVSNVNGGVVREYTQFANRVAGNYSSVWNGRDDGGQVLPPGDYRVRVRATAPSGLVGTSDPVTVTLDRFFTATRTKTQNGDAFDRRGTPTVLRGGGSCSVRRLTTPHDVQVNCRDARVRVFWRWTLNEPDAAIQSQGFTLIAVSGYTCGASFGRTGNGSGSDTWIQVGALGQRRCRVDKARITYSFTDES